MLHAAIIDDCYRQVLKVGHSVNKMIELNIQLSKLLAPNQTLMLEQGSKELIKYLICESDK